MPKMFVLPLAFSATLLASACVGGGAEDVEQAEEEAGVEEVVPEEATPTPLPTPPAAPTSPQEEWMKMSEAEKAQQKAKNMEKGQAPVFEGEHENLQSGDTATWGNGLSMTVSDVHISPNEGRQEDLERMQKQKAKEEEAKAAGKKVPPQDEEKEAAKMRETLEEPEELIAFHWHIENNGTETVNLGGDLPCEALDENGVAAPGGKAASRPERQERQAQKAKGLQRVLEQPLEPGQEREVWRSVVPPIQGDTIEIVCVQPPRASGGPGKAKVAQAPDGSKASWLIDVSELERRG
jgi:hypothetical protein